jgi:hypothetical protein
MATKLKFNRKFGKKILALLLSVLTVFTCITPVMSVLADSSIKDVWSSGGMADKTCVVNFDCEQRFVQLSKIFVFTV